MLLKVEVSLQPVGGKTMFDEGEPLLCTAAGGHVEFVVLEDGAEGAIVSAGAEAALLLLEVVMGSI